MLSQSFLVTAKLVYARVSEIFFFNRETTIPKFESLSTSQERLLGVIGLFGSEELITSTLSQAETKLGRFPNRIFKAYLVKIAVLSAPVHLQQDMHPLKRYVTNDVPYVLIPYEVHCQCGGII